MRGDAPRLPACPRLGPSRSPHARGCTAQRRLAQRPKSPFPACAGMHRHGAWMTHSTRSVPRMRGDAPRSTTGCTMVVARSPHARGCTAVAGPPRLRRRPFPACAGMHRSRRWPRSCAGAVPRMRGDAPNSSAPTTTATARSPHARGCTGLLRRDRRPAGPFPACAGMHREPFRSKSCCSARSPHARGCTELTNARQAQLVPFPACAGMHRMRGSASSLRAPVPRMRGDAPLNPPRVRAAFVRSPHARGCTAARTVLQAYQGPFPACAGMHRQ